MRIMIAGDTHGDTCWVRTYLLPMAHALRMDKLIIVGDFGAWEHTPPGVAFMDEVNRCAAVFKIDVYWLHGNHDKWSLTMERYGHLRDPDGFVLCRNHVLYIPQAHAWTWNGVRFRSFGGAYSVDKAYRLEKERYRERQQFISAYQKLLGQSDVVDSSQMRSHAGTLWFPEEEMTDDEMEQFLLDDHSPKDVILSHDKPASAKPDWDRKDIPACMPNQLRLDRALRLHRPRWWIHGHLHYHYDAVVSGAGWHTRVVGLNPNAAAAEHPDWRADKSWLTLSCVGGKAIVQLHPDDISVIEKRFKTACGMLI